MAKLKLNPAPTFTAQVKIPVPGGESDPVTFTFKHRKRTDTIDWLKTTSTKEDYVIVQDMAAGWDLDDEFTPDNIATLCDNYPGAGGAILDAYLAELRGARAKN
ncbi:phage tail assembly chaperone [Dyella caseinilytica]|uniref:Tail assembly chaperone n=1 Tax=Dyella caseinilytica TaxID=1849581 RepID=A0ABX7GPP6_9GAMM|nr:phage tail assembly chaperone [Dyella caseinilytica]QRN52390.1 hypothetical protein ISN74_12980 [Dyella caseinilytica]GGA05586.1 hypothetical protein GCM10011408_28130 [Dyella caseinilytica]